MSQPPSRRPTHAAASRREANQAMRTFSYLLAGPLTYGVLGWVGDRLLGTSFLLPVGIVGGMALAVYLIWFRYGSR